MQAKHQPKKNSLVVSTNHESAFDSRWAEIKIQGKNIPTRSNHISVIHNSRLYIHGGYDADKGVLGDFYAIDLIQNTQFFEWKKLNNTIGGKPIKLKGHTAIVHKDKLILFGGQLPTYSSTNQVYAYQFEKNQWTIPEISGVKIPQIDSHSAVLYENKMYIYGGYIPNKAQFMNTVYSLDLDKMQWVQVDDGKNSPQPRSNFSMVADGGYLYIFGGTNGEHTLNDFWKFHLTSKKWEQIKAQNMPQPRRGHSMISFQNTFFLFGGIQNITKEKNDIYIYQLKNNSWNKIHSSTNSIYDCSPTLKQEKKKTQSPERIQLHKMSTDKSPEKDSDVMKKIMAENRHKKFMERKKQMLRQFTDKPSSEYRSHSPTTESMLKTLQSIGNQETSKKQLKQQIMYDDSHRFIVGKKPCARDGQTVCINDGKMYIFGGDRHLMAFNDLYSFDLEKGLKSLELYRS